MKLQAQWNKRNEYNTKSRKLWDKGHKLITEAAKLRAEGHKLWAEAILAEYGNIQIEWEGKNNCILHTPYGPETYRG